MIGLILLVCLGLLLNATYKSIGLIGSAIFLIFCGLFLVFLKTNLGITFDNPNTILWIGIVIVSICLGIGVKWSLLWRKVTGQYQVDEIEE